ncbi:hypothetical protein [Klebsiella variicola]|uniref:hypothetical protein n=1 Tax=Klebsiella variicola TaxID=244366 RepID=UPI001BD456F9|nr:hypothetical protein [Klebsiella variicola]
MKTILKASLKVRQTAPLLKCNGNPARFVVVNCRVKKLNREDQRHDTTDEARRSSENKKSEFAMR